MTEVADHTDIPLSTLRPDDASSTSTLTISDGGLRAWLAVLGGYLVIFSTFGYSNSFGVYQDYYTLHGSSSSSDISWIGSLQLCLMFAVGLPAGRLFDRGYFRTTSVAGTLLYSFSLFMLSLASPQKFYQLLLSQGVGMGLGAGLLVVPAMSLQGHYWKKRRSLAMGLVAAGSGSGGLVYPIMLNRLFNGTLGFAWGVRVSAFVTFALLVIASCVMTTRTNGAKEDSQPPQPHISTVLTDVPYVLLVVGGFLSLWGLFFPYFYLQVWANVHGLSDNLAFYTIAILNAASVIGRMLPNMIADYAGMFNMIIPSTFITGALTFAMFGATSPAGVVVFAILYGFFSGASIALLPPTAASLAKDYHEIGLRLGVIYFVTSFALLTGTPISGALLDVHNQWPGPIIFNAVVLISGSVFMLISRQILAKRKCVCRI
ncbi:MFS general substrate transporter [Wolfiporia cocos MD-104 SS10]|uniref:MFS general substrate transporter n=1 Tax=Wolfiporia cocos (strain MD-104) TaxID=742152 RepID=A0A2H3IXW6_WOLCO|nr:MFS general substrate transporter [Wolfiporia cocos MD-104 SS10]